MSTQLTVKQRLFVKEYLIDKNATQAAKRAGYSRQTARAIGAENLTKPAVRSAINSELSKQAVRAELTADRVLAEYIRIAFADIRDAICWTVDEIDVKPTAELNERVSVAISEVNVTPSGVIKFKMHDKLKALDALSRHLKLFSEQSEGSVGGELKAILDAACNQGHRLPADTSPERKARSES